MIPHQQQELDFDGLKLIRGGRYPNWRDRPDWLVEYLIPHAGVGMLTASEKVGKTWQILNVGLCVASGEPFLGRFAVKQGPVLIYSPEGDRKDLEDRIDQLSYHLGVDPTRLDFFTAEMHGLVLDFADHQEMIRQAIQSTRARLVIFDPLRDCMDGQVSNNDDATRVTKFCQSLQNQFNCAVMISHHENFEGRMMGAGAWRQFADYLWHMKEEGDRIRFSNIQRKEKLVDDLFLRRVKVDDRVMIEIVEETGPKKELDDHILEFLQGLPGGDGATVRHIRESLRDCGIQAGNDKVSAAINRLKSHRAILPTPPYGYRVATEADFAEKETENRSVREGVSGVDPDRTTEPVSENLSGPAPTQGVPPGRTAFQDENAPETGNSGPIHLSGNDFKDIPPCKGGSGGSPEPSRLLAAREVDFLPQPEPEQGYPWIGVDLGRPTPQPVSFWWQSFALMEHLEEAGFDTTDIHGMADYETPPCKGGRGDSPSSGA